MTITNTKFDAVERKDAKFQVTLFSLESFEMEAFDTGQFSLPFLQCMAGTCCSHQVEILTGERSANTNDENLLFEQMKCNI